MTSNKPKMSSKEIAKALDDKVENSKEGAVSILSEEVLIFILDCSGSMSSGMGRGGSKFGSMIKAASNMLEERNSGQASHNDLVGIIAFGSGHGGWGNSESDVKLVAYPGIVSDKMVQDVVKLQCVGGTPMFAALRKGMEVLDQSTQGLGRLVLLSDGHPSDSSTNQILEYASSHCEETGFVIDTIGIGSSTGFDYDEEFMKELARRGGGEFYRCDEADELSARLLEMESERRALIGEGVFLLGE